MLVIVIIIESSLKFISKFDYEMRLRWILAHSKYRTYCWIAFISNNFKFICEGLGCNQYRHDPLTLLQSNQSQHKLLQRTCQTFRINLELSHSQAGPPHHQIVTFWPSLASFSIIQKTIVERQKLWSLQFVELLDTLSTSFPTWFVSYCPVNCGLSIVLKRSLVMKPIFLRKFFEKYRNSGNNSNFKISIIFMLFLFLMKRDLLF